MSGNQAWKNWLVIFILLVAFALVTAVWSGLVGNVSLPTLGGSSSPASVPVENEDIDFEILPVQITQPIPLTEIAIDFTAFEGIRIEDINPYVAIGVLFGVVVGGIVVVGGLIAGPMMLFSRAVSNVKESDSYKEGESRLANSEKELIKQMNEGRSTKTRSHERPRWSAISTSLIILMFAWFISLVLNGTFFPEGFTFLGGDPERYIRTTPIFAWVTLGTTLLALIAWMRPKSLQMPETTSGGSAIPWDTIAVIFTGLAVVGLGIGAMAYLLTLSG